jgi:hypothetical protein
MKYGIDKFIGKWVDEEGYQLEIKKVDKTKALVSLFSDKGHPISRPYWENKLTIDMPAKYDEYDGTFDIHLWEPEKSFCLNLNELFSEINDDNGECLAVSITRYEEDNFLDQYYYLFGKLSHYKKTK